MDITINPVSGATQQTAAPIPKSVNSAPPATIKPATATPPPPMTFEQKSAQVSSGADHAYQAALRQAAISFKNVYAVSDTNFTIFKDATGKYITRYVSLRDGSITYIPEPTLVKEMQMSGGRLAINA